MSDCPICSAGFPARKRVIVGGKNENGEPISIYMDPDAAAKITETARQLLRNMALKYTPGSYVVSLSDSMQGVVVEDATAPNCVCIMWDDGVRSVYDITVPDGIDWLLRTVVLYR